MAFGTYIKSNTKCSYRTKQARIIHVALTLIVGFAGHSLAQPVAIKSVLESSPKLGGTLDAVGDIDGDNRAELVFSALGTSSCFIYCLKWDGNDFELIWRSRELGLGLEMAIGDLDNDGLQEISIVGLIEGTFGLLTLKWSDKKLAESLYKFPSGFEPEHIEVGDLNNDGKNEAILSRVDNRSEGSSSESITVWELDGKKLDGKKFYQIAESTGHSWISDLLVTSFSKAGKNELLVSEGIDESRYEKASSSGILLCSYRMDSGRIEKIEIPALQNTLQQGVPTFKLADLGNKDTQTVAYLQNGVATSFTARDGKGIESNKMQIPSKDVRDIFGGYVMGGVTQNIVISFFDEHSKFAVYELSE